MRCFPASSIQVITFATYLPAVLGLIRPLAGSTASGPELLEGTSARFWRDLIESF